MTSPLPSLLPFLPALPLTSVEAAHARFTELAGQAAQAGITLRAPPPEPDTCCGGELVVRRGAAEAAGVWMSQADRY